MPGIGLVIRENSLWKVENVDKVKTIVQDDRVLTAKC